jgi:type IV pilus assembly protein PilO
MAYKDWHIGAQFGVAIGGALLLVFVGWSYVPNLKQMREDIASKKQELAQLEEEIRKGKILEKNLPSLRREIAQLEIKLGDLKAIIPPVRDDSQLVERIKSLADRSRLAILSTNFQGLRDHEFYKEYPINLVIRGSYHDLAIFFDRLSREARIFNIAGLTIQSQQGGGGQTIQGNFQAITFIYKDDQPAAPGGPS